jgi:hypothetical protein
MSAMDLSRGGHTFRVEAERFEQSAAVFRHGFGPIRGRAAEIE